MLDFFCGVSARTLEDSGFSPNSGLITGCEASVDKGYMMSREFPEHAATSGVKGWTSRYVIATIRNSFVEIETLLEAEVRTRL